MAKLVLNPGGVGQREFPLVPGLNRIGRAPGNEVRLEMGEVSGCHCELWLMRERLLVRDLGSTNGTYVNGHPITEIEAVDGQVLGVGGVALQIQGLKASPPPSAPPVPPVAPVNGGAAAEPVVRIPRLQPDVPPPPPRFTPDGLPCCANHSTIEARFRCRTCGEQFCRDCVRSIRRRGGLGHDFCPACGGECVSVGPVRPPGGTTGPQWLSKLTQTLRLRR